ncbi:MAG: selenocysteine-specific translation elongation factor [Deltaproteobacteria bacterium]
MKSFIVGTAGHIDHGKTALTKALTGIDTDRLPQEKERGISIELGFAPLRFSDEFVVGIVDVPGHERFVKTMVMGAAQIDLVLFVIAANEGMMPQSREHLSILTLLGIKKGIVVLSKADLLCQEERLFTLDRLQKELRGTFLEISTPLFVSAKTGEGIDALKQKIFDCDQIIGHQNRSEGVTRVFIDRVFTLPGHGTIVTGPLISGCLRLEDQLELYPLGKMVRVRQIHAYGKSYAELNAPSRAALNIKGVSKVEVHRGEVLGKKGALSVTKRASAQLEKKAEGYFTIHIGTSRAQVKIRPLDQTGHSFLRFSKPLALLPGDRFILRRETTSGGGIIINPNPLEKASIGFGKKEKPIVDAKPLFNGALYAAILNFFQSRSNTLEAFEITDLVKKFGSAENEINPVLKALQNKREITRLPGDFYISSAGLASLKLKLADFFKTHSEMRVIDLKNMFSISRKFAIPYLQFFDEQKWTVRKGDVRVPWKII